MVGWAAAERFCYLGLGSSEFFHAECSSRGRWREVYTLFGDGWGWVGARLLPAQGRWTRSDRPGLATEGRFGRLLRALG